MESGSDEALAPWTEPPSPLTPGPIRPAAVAQTAAGGRLHEGAKPFPPIWWKMVP